MPKPVAITYPSANAVTVEREFDAPADLVFACHTQPKLIQRWLLGPDGWTMPVCEVALNVGGTYRYVWRSISGDHEFGFTGVFKELEAPTRVVHTESMIGQPGEAVVTTLFIQQGKRTRLSVTMAFESEAMREQVLATGMTDGMAVSYDRLEELLAEQVA